MIRAKLEDFVSLDAKKHIPYAARNGCQGSPVRILHVVGRMDRAGIQTWLMNVLRHVDRTRFQMDFLVHSDKPGHYDAEIRSLGSQVLYGAPLRQVWKYGGVTTNLFRHTPRYDIVHSHLDYFSGYPLKCAVQAGIPVRIVHSHNDLTRSFSRLTWPRKIYVHHSRSLIFRHATHGLACSVTAAESLFAKPRCNLQWRVLPYGIDLSPFSPKVRGDDICREFGIPDNAVVVGHVGRFAQQKNHQMVVNIAEALSKRSTNFRLVLVGDGPLRPTIEENINKRGLRNHVTFAGVRADIPRLLTSLFDVFLFPSLFEGLPVVILEALAASCPVVISDVISPEVDVVPNLVTRLALSVHPDQWADAVLHAASESRSYEKKMTAFEAIKKTPINISTCVQNLTNLYLREMSRIRAA